MDKETRKEICRQLSRRYDIPEITIVRILIDYKALSVLRETENAQRAEEARKLASDGALS
jgi:hypothetical protein